MAAPRPRLSAAARRIVLAALLLGLSACSSPPGPAAGAGGGRAAAATGTWPALPVGHAGRWLTDAAGRVVLVHGVNVVEKQPPYFPSAFGFSSADASFLEREGFSAVRLGVLFTGLMPRPGSVDDSYLAEIARTVAVLEDHHLLVLLDVHQDGFGPAVGSDGFPAWMTLTDGATNTHAGFPAYYATDPAVQQAFQSLWADARGPGGTGLVQDVEAGLRALGRRFASFPGLLGYDVLNEPWPGRVWQPCLGPTGCPRLDATELDPFYAGVDRALRSADPTHLVFFEPFVLFNFGSAPAGVRLPRGERDAGLSFHEYALGASSSEGVLEHALAWSRATGGALLDTEWGATTDPAAIRSQAARFDSNLLPWIFWSFDGYVVRSLSRPPRGPNLDGPVLAALVRPYPLVVAGTPLSLSYDPATRVLRFAWSTERASGRGRFGAGAVTTLEVPPGTEPAGYHVLATGARVTSRPCSPLLTLALQPAVPRASVVVLPGGSCVPPAG